MSRHSHDTPVAERRAKRRRGIIEMSGIVWLLFFALSILIAGTPAFGESRGHSVEKRIIELVNQMRSRGCMCGNRYFKKTKPVEWNDTLGKVCLGHSLDMAEHESMGHAGTDGSGPGRRIARSGYNWRAYGENVGEGYLLPEEVVRGWLKSQGHCENIMNPLFKEAGAARVKGMRHVYWTLVLAAPESSSRSSR